VVDPNSQAVAKGQLTDCSLHGCDGAIAGRQRAVPVIRQRLEESVLKPATQTQFGNIEIAAELDSRQEAVLVACAEEVVVANVLNGLGMTRSCPPP